MIQRKSLFSDERLKRLSDLSDIRVRRAKAQQNRRFISNLQYVPSGEVLDKLATLAAIAHVPPEEGGTLNAHFNARIIGHVLTAHTVAGICNVKKEGAHKSGAYHARELVKYLKADGKLLSYFLDRYETVDDYIESIDCLAQEAQIVARLAKVPRSGSSMTLARKYFVERLLNIVADAGGA